MFCRIAFRTSDWLTSSDGCTSEMQSFIGHWRPCKKHKLWGAKVPPPRQTFDLSTSCTGQPCHGLHSCQCSASYAIPFSTTVINALCPHPIRVLGIIMASDSFLYKKRLCVFRRRHGGKRIRTLHGAVTASGGEVLQLADSETAGAEHWRLHRDLTEPPCSNINHSCLHRLGYGSGHPWVRRGQVGSRPIIFFRRVAGLNG